MRRTAAATSLRFIFQIAEPEWNRSGTRIKRLEAIS
jgi:hypothetical protein